MIRGYEIAVQTTVTATASAAATLLTGATYRAKVREIGIFSNAATAYTGGIGRPAAVGVTSGGGGLGQAQEPADAASTVSLVTTWSTQPTAPTLYMRRFDFNNVPGSGVIFTWPSDGEIMVSVSGNLVTPYNIVTAPTNLDVYTVYGE